jgi:hypothetical protein
VASSVSGMVRPSALAVLRLMTSSNLVGFCTGRSAGLSPLRTRGQAHWDGVGRCWLCDRARCEGIASSASALTACVHHRKCDNKQDQNSRILHHSGLPARLRRFGMGRLSAPNCEVVHTSTKGLQRSDVAVGVMAAGAHVGSRGGGRWAAAIAERQHSLRSSRWRRGQLRRTPSSEAR